MDKLKKNSKLKATEVLSKSKFFNEKDMVPTDVPMINVALSGSVDGGITPCLTVLAGPSKHFKTSFAFIVTVDTSLVMVLQIVVPGLQYVAYPI